MTAQPTRAISDIERLERELRTVTSVIAMYRFAIAREADLQAGIAAALDRAAYHQPFLFAHREVRLDDQSRIDLLTNGGIGIEVKTQGRVGPVRHQLERYLQHERVEALLLVTTVSMHMVLKGTIQTPKPFGVLSLRTGIW